MGRPLRVLHLVGSPTDARHLALSRRYAADALDALADDDRYAPLVALVHPDGSWRFPEDLSDAAVAAAPPLTFATAVACLAAARPDVAVPQLFCRRGLTDHRALLALLGIPSVGNPAHVMATTFDKAATRAIVAAAGVRVPDAEVVPAGGTATLGLPAVVKPVAADNSDGVTLVREPRELPAALARAWAHGDALVETYVPLGREVRCGTIVRDGEVVALPLEEYAVGPDAPVRTTDDKLATTDEGGLELVAKDPSRAWIVAEDDPLTDVAGAVAAACHRALSCRHHGLIDLRIDPDGQPWFLEAGPYCSFARSSVIVTMAEAAGIDLPTLFAEAVAQALTGDATVSPPGAR